MLDQKVIAAEEADRLAGVVEGKLTVDKKTTGTQGGEVEVVSEM